MVEGLFSMSQVHHNAAISVIIEKRKYPEVGVYRKCIKEPVLHLGGEWAALFLGFVIFLLCFETVLFVPVVSQQV
jgi:hypothetical protein